MAPEGASWTLHAQCTNGGALILVLSASVSRPQSKPPTSTCDRVLMHYFRELWDLDITELVKQLETLSATPFTPSNVHEVASAENRIAADVRMSQSRALSDQRLFDAADRLVERLSDSDDIMAFTLVRRDVSHLKYKPCDFFKPHQDYLALTSNCIQVR
jgi:hypothetical protein